jgi:hypothetical protein
VSLGPPISNEGGRHPATTSAWRWLESRSLNEMGPRRRERIARLLREMDAQLHDLDTSKVVPK